jgi:uncharacterized membrane protein
MIRMSCNLVNTVDVDFLPRTGWILCALDFLGFADAVESARRNMFTDFSGLRMLVRTQIRVIVGFLLNKAIISNLQAVSACFFRFTAQQCC